MEAMSNLGAHGPSAKDGNGGKRHNTDERTRSVVMGGRRKRGMLRYLLSPSLIAASRVRLIIAEIGPPAVCEGQRRYALANMTIVLWDVFLSVYWTFVHQKCESMKAKDKLEMNIKSRVNLPRDII